MKRVNIEACINIRIQDNGRVSAKCFEVVKARTIQGFNEAISLFKHLHSHYETVYIYDTSVGYRVEFKTYTDSLQKAQDIRDSVEYLLEVWEDDKK